MNYSINYILVFSVLISSSEYCYAWGERGHDLVTRIAARIISLDASIDKSVGESFLVKEHMLSHLSNVPDIVWRNMGKDIETPNAPTHYFNIEYITSDPSAPFPKNKVEMETAMKKLCVSMPKGYKCPDKHGTNPKADMAGTAPFRIHQLATLMQESFQQATEEQKKSPVTESLLKKHLDDAFFYAGILSHFVGDLANPYHTTRDYNGYEINQGGVHSYFESETVNAFDLGFDMEVYTKALELKNLKTLMTFANPSIPIDYLEIAFAQTKESFSILKLVQELDLKHAVTKLGNRDKGLNIKAERKPTNQIAIHFRSVIRDRIAQGAATLAWLWQQAWIKGGKPSLKGYVSYDYRTTPEFVPTNFD